MKKLSISKMADTVISKRKELKITQVQLAEKTGINRGMISRLESCDYTPSIEQLQSIAEILDFEVVDLFEDDKPTETGYCCKLGCTGWCALLYHKSRCLYPVQYDRIL